MMERMLFDWEGWDQSGMLEFTYYDCVLKQKIGEYEEGTKIATISVSFESGEMTFWDADGESLLAKYQLTISAAQSENSQESEKI